MADYQFVTDRLAVGGAIWTLENMREIALAGITHVVNMQREFDDRTIAEETGIEVLWIECDDDFLPKPTEVFWDGVLFTLEALQDPQARLLFHCAAGVHRGPMMLLAVLRVLGYEPQHAMGMIAAVRPQADFPEAYVSSVEGFVREYYAAVDSETSPGELFGDAAE